MPNLQHLPADAESSAIVSAVQQDGAVILDDDLAMKVMQRVLSQPAESRCRFPRPTESEHGAIFRLRACQAEAMDGRRAQRRQDADFVRS